MPAQMTDREMLESLEGTVCSSCGRKKKSMMSHCSKCYYLLPPSMRRALYKRFNEGYQAAFLHSLDYLEEDRNGSSTTKGI